MTGCVFCRIIAGEIPAERLHDDDLVVAIRDINPQAPTHVLILPKRHIGSLMDSDGTASLYGRIVEVARALAQRLGVADRGFRLLVNTGPEGGQAVPHVHFHLMGGRTMGWPPG
ncbi:MAG: histidine triad nucleotide-binding protein [bacterium]